MSGVSEIPPTYYFSGIKFNPSFYQSSSSDYLTLATAKTQFLTYPTAQGSETISTLTSSTINSSTINPISDASSFSIVPSQYDGILNIGTGARSLLGAINIGTGSTNVANPITIGSDMSALNLYGTVSIKSGNLIVDSTSISCGSFLSPGATTSCTFASNVQSVPITLGQGMLSSSIDIANNISFNGNVTIANSATSGTNNIQLGNTRTTTTINGALTLAGATTVNTETTFNSIVNIKGDTLANTVAFSGNIGYEATSAATYTIGTTGATALNIRYILRVNAASTITVPGSTRSQYITIRSTTTGLVTINMASGVTVILNGNSTTSTTTNLTTGGSITFYSILSSQYIQI